MSKKYEYKCPDCGKEIEYRSEFCEQCNCKINWDDEDNSIDNKVSNSSKIIRVINLFLLSFVLCLSAYIIGVNLEVYDMNLTQIFMSASLDFVIYTFVFMIYPLILRIKVKDKLSLDYDKKIKTSTVIGAFVIAGVYSFIIQGKSSFAFGFLMRMYVYSIIYYFINKWLFIKDTNKGKNSILSITVLIVLIVSTLFGVFSINGNTNNKSINSSQEEYSNYMRASHILVDDYDTAEKIINKLDDGYDFSKLAKQYSLDTATSESGGDIGYFEEGDMVEEFEEAVKNLNINEYTSVPVLSDYGYHIILRTN